MTAGQQMLLGSGARFGVQPFDIVQLRDDKAGNNAVASIEFQGGGYLLYTGNASSGSGVWNTPAGAAAGPGKYIKLVLNSGTAPFQSSAVNTVLPLNALSDFASWQWVQTAVGGQVANCTVTIYSDAAGTLVLYSDTFPVTVNRTS